MSPDVGREGGLSRRRPSIAERPLGRRMLALLDLVDSPLRRRDVLAFLTDGWLLKETRERYGNAPIGQWESATRRAGVVEGLDQWRARLGGLIEREHEESIREGAPNGSANASSRRGTCCDSWRTSHVSSPRTPSAGPGRNASRRCNSSSRKSSRTPTKCSGTSINSSTFSFKVGRLEQGLQSPGLRSATPRH